MKFKEIYKDANFSDDQLTMLECIFDCMAPETKQYLEENGRTMTFATVDNNLYESILRNYPTNLQFLHLIANFRQPNVTTAVGPGETLMVLFIDGARFALRSEESDIVIDGKHIEMKGELCRISGQKTRYDSARAYEYTKDFAKQFFGLTLRSENPNASSRGMCEILEKLTNCDFHIAIWYLQGLAKIIDPVLGSGDLYYWAVDTLRRLKECPREVVVPDPKFKGRGKKRVWCPDNTKTVKIVASKSIGPEFIQCQGELCFNRYARDEHFDQITTFNKETGAIGTIRADRTTIYRVAGMVAGKLRFMKGIGLGNQDNGPQAELL